MKVDDWGYHDFELGQVKEITDGRVTEFTTCYIRTGGYDLNFYPLTSKTKVISDGFKAVSSEIHREGHAGLNYPDIHRWLVDRWEEALALDENDAQAVRKVWDQLETFKRAMLEPEPPSKYGFPKIRRRVA